MTLQKAKLTEVLQVSSSAGSVYANPSSTKTFIKSILVFNSHSSDVVLKLYNVPDSTGSLGTAATANQVLEKTLISKESFEWSLNYPLTLTDTNDSIQAQANITDVLNIQIYGDKDI